MINLTNKSIRTKDIIRDMQSLITLPGEDCEDAYKAVITVLEHHLLQGNKVNLHGFGTFEPKELKPIKGKRFEKNLDLPKRGSIKFTPSDSLKGKMNGKH